MRVATDIALSADGDLIIQDYDLALASEGQFQLQSAINRIKSIKIDWRHDNIGADMEDLIGMPNNPTTADLGKQKIIDALTEDGLFNIEDVYVRPVPVNKTNIMFFTFINSPYFAEPIGLAVSLDLTSGGIMITEG